MSNRNKVDNSDYTKRAMETYKALPEVYQSDTNKAMCSNLFDRFLSKKDVVAIAGYIGKGSSNAIIKRQIVEDTVHRQAFQLQPIVSNKIGSVEHMLSWADMLHKLDRLGIDVEDVDVWGELLQFNWIPPIDIDKLIHFNDYYWVNNDALDSKPQYITVRNELATVAANLSMRNDSEVAVQLDQDDDCIESVGWDNARWDDNPSNPVWGSTINGDSQTHEEFIDSISNSGPPPTTGTVNQLWYDTNANTLQQYYDEWKVLIHNFSDTIADTDGTSLWDLKSNCVLNGGNAALSQWIEENHWVHKSEVSNFSTAKQAQLPILEYRWDIELNEWTHTTYNWKYRQDQSSAWETTNNTPPLIELIPLIDWTDTSTTTTTEISLDEKYGNQTTTFVVGSKFQASGVDEIYEVINSTYSTDSDGLPYQTRILLDVPLDSTGLIPGVTALIPHKTVVGDSWKSYGDHWLFVGQDSTLPTSHMTPNPAAMIPIGDVPIVDVSGLYEYSTTYYAQQYTVLVDSGISSFPLSNTVKPGTSRSLRVRAMKGMDDIRVYVNDVRQYGTYDEVDDDLAGFVTGILFTAEFTANKFDVVRIEVGESTPTDFGLTRVPVRMVEDNDEYLNTGNVDVSVVGFRKVEQNKTSINQYPLFDVYGIDGYPAGIVNALFGYRIDPTAEVNPNIGMRNSYDVDSKLYEFDQFLLDADNSKLRTFRNYSNRTTYMWFDLSHNVLNFWTGDNWDDLVLTDNHYIRAITSDTEPVGFYKTIDGMYWVDTINLTVNRWSTITSTWSVQTDVTISAADPTHQTIWKKGINDETYIPAKVDWDNRSQDEYQEQKNQYIDVQVTALMLADPTLDRATATVIAMRQWLETQANTHSPDGTWVGAWEIPDPLYYNVMNENRKIVNSQQLLTHFETVIQSQPEIPGYTGPIEGMFHLLGVNDVNYGLGGTIKQYNNSFDTFVSSIFVDGTTPISLLQYAQSQYENLLNGLREIYVRNSTEIFTDTSLESLIDLSTIATELVLSAHNNNDNTTAIYGDSTTYDSDTLIGMKNWIMTLPYLGTVMKHHPIKLVDANENINQVLHHDGHLHQYVLPSAIAASMVQRIINADDTRTGSHAVNNPADTFGRNSVNQPPNDIHEFNVAFNSPIIGRPGVYWYYSPTTQKPTLYRLAVASVGEYEPPSTSTIGSLWVDTTIGREVLRQKNKNAISGYTWDVVTGLSVGDNRLHNGTDPYDIDTSTVSAWEVIDLEYILSDVILAAELKLYANVPDRRSLLYDADVVKDVNPDKFNAKLLRQFYTYTLQHEISNPLGNTLYSASLPFTWNYKFCTVGAGTLIVSTDATQKTFVVGGDLTPIFSIVGSTFYVKNSKDNSGTWKISAPATYDSVLDSTNIFVTTPVATADDGVIYSGLLPSEDNTGAESGGDWRDLNTKFFGTPYPHIEPWKLQGYTDMPNWWIAEYANDDTETWGDRRWKHKYGLDIVGVSTISNTFEVVGDFISTLVTGLSFIVDNSLGSNDGSYIIGTGDTVLSVDIGMQGSGIIHVAGDVHDIYTNTTEFITYDNVGTNGLRFSVINSTYNVNTDITSIRVMEEILPEYIIDHIGGSLFDATLNKTTIIVSTNIADDVVGGRIQISIGMWENIKSGTIPPNTTYSNGVMGITGIPTTDRIVHGLQPPKISRYRYFSVNISNVDVSVDGGVTVFGPDEIFPPFWNHISWENSSDVPFGGESTIRSIFHDFNTEIKSPGVDYSFGDRGNVEWEWYTSSQWLYDQLQVAYKLDPIKYTTDTFGIEIIDVAGLDVSIESERAIRHCSTSFHGDMVGSTLYSVNGTNQWYVNFNRYTGFDTNGSNFRTLWTDWTAPLSYQFASFIDTSSMSIAHASVDVSSADYAIHAKTSSGVDDFWLDALKLTVLTVPPDISRYNNQLDWKIEVSTNIDISREIEYYDVQNYPFYANPTDNICTLVSWAIIDLDTYEDTFSVVGNQTEYFTIGREVEVKISTGNDGMYRVVSVVHDIITDTTIIGVDSNILSTVRDGIVVTDYRTLPWSTGDAVYLSTDETLPIPLKGDTVNGLTKYFIIVESDTTFKIANTNEDAINGNGIDILSVGRRNQYVGSVIGTFRALEGKRTSLYWRHYVIDKRHLLSLDTPAVLQGMQTIIDLVDGYDTKLSDTGWAINDDNSLHDPVSGRLVGWQQEVERFISYAYALQVRKYITNDRYQVSANVSNDTWSFINSDRNFVTGDAIQLFSSNGVFPVPFIRGIKYYMIRDDLSTFRLAVSAADAINNISVQIQSTSGTDELFITSAIEESALSDTHEINPFREAVWFNPSYGVVSNLVNRASDDIQASPQVYDQDGQPIDVDFLHVFREDKQTKLAVATNQVEVLPLGSSPYDKRHIGGMHILLDAQEHIMRFNNYTTNNAMIYDSFVGLNVTKFEMMFDRMPEFTGRPNVGGYYLSTFFNQEADMHQNIEASIEGLRHLYDTNGSNENDVRTLKARETVGYTGPAGYLDAINVNDKSQFIFWKGQIQHKGSVNAIKAYINSKRFREAKIDEFWAIKIADYGSAAEKEYPEMYVNTSDARSNDFKIQFITAADYCHVGYDSNTYSASPCGYSFPNDNLALPIALNGFTAISLTDTYRWYNQPDQLEILKDNGLTLYFDLAACKSIPVDILGLEECFDDIDKTHGIIQLGYLTPGNQLYDVGGYGMLSDARAAPTTFYMWSDLHNEWEANGSWDETTDAVIRHNMNVDYVTITVKLYDSKEIKEYTGNTGTELEVAPYIPNGNGIAVFVNGIKQDLGSDYIEPVDVNETIYSTTLLFRVALVPSDVIIILHGTTVLVPELHYDMVNSNIITMQGIIFELTIFPDINDLIIWGNVANVNAQSPAKLLDKQAHTALHDIPHWDPARGVHNNIAVHNVDVRNNVDPATYDVTPISQSVASTHIKIIPWNANQVGVTWLDTSRLDYLPYYDTGITPVLDDRLRDWGALADWGTAPVLEWVKSTVPPSEYISNGNEFFGHPYKTLFYNVGDETNPEWKVATDIFEDHDAIVDGTLVEASEYDFVMRDFVEGDEVKVYVDGRFVADREVGLAGSVQGIRCGNVSRVRFMQAVPTDEDIIAEGIESGTMLHEYLYVTTSYFDSFGVELPLYYFWVRSHQKITSDKNRSMTSFNAEQALVAGPTPYLVYAGPKNAQTVVVDGNDSIDRIELQQAAANQSVFVLSLPVVLNTVVSVRVDGVPVPEDEVSYRDNIVTLENPITQAALTEIRYTGRYSNTVDLPIRFNQVIIRGLQGIIDADRRYTIRFIRDFTLRDKLQVCGTDTQMKNLHEEWLMFREYQPYHIERYLWDKVTEAMVGFKLSDSTVRVPTHERELYDEKFQSDTQYGLRTGQAITNGAMAINTIMGDLENPNNDFGTIDISIFFARESFDTDANIIHAMDLIYNTFGFQHVNRIMFAIIHDALSLKREYPDLFKTSMVALHGIQPIQTSGIYDE